MFTVQSAHPWNMDRILALVSEFLAADPDNRISGQVAISPKSIGLKLFEAPLCGLADADDSLFFDIKQPGVVGPHFLAPREWLPDADTVISFFFPFSADVRRANRSDKQWPAEEWLHARIEGQAFLNKFQAHLRDALASDGYESIAPDLDPRFRAKAGAYFGQGDEPNRVFTSNWSQRHVAFVCGLGTFGLSAGMITEKGMAGRFCSIITTASILPRTVRAYSAPYEYCSRCGLCAKNCPVNAISLEHGKDHLVCSNFLDAILEKHNPRYGCGKCQVRVPCEAARPGLRHWSQEKFFNP